jgi:3',5'-cyclic AMP phosphodiesterase CpdA
LKIAHISDLHFPINLPVWGLNFKQWTGYWNYSFRRKKRYLPEVRDALFQKIKKCSPDYILITGDITNVSHPIEFKKSQQLLQPILGKNTMMIPGNHDRYVPESLKHGGLFESHFESYMGELIPGLPRSIRIRKEKNFAFVGVDTSYPTGVGIAEGEFPLESLDGIFQYLEEKKISSYFLLVHHPVMNPSWYTESKSHRMKNRDDLVSRLKEKPPIAVFHGHSHTNWISEPNSTLPFWVINSASSTHIPDSNHSTGFHTLDWEKGKVTLTRYAWSESISDFEISPLMF